jgi:hypothetical protein
VNALDADAVAVGMLVALREHEAARILTRRAA